MQALLGVPRLLHVTSLGGTAPLLLFGLPEDRK